MNFIAICLHCLDMRDFHSAMRDTPFLDQLRTRSVFIPMGRAQGHHQGDSLNAELTGQWTARQSDSHLDEEGYKAPTRCWLPPTVMEHLQASGYDILTCMTGRSGPQVGSWAVSGGMPNYWLRDEPERMGQFSSPRTMTRDEWHDAMRTSDRFYAHIILRETHRPWGETDNLHRLMDWRERIRHHFDRDRNRQSGWPYDAYCARRAALEKPDAFAGLRRRALARTDRLVQEVIETAAELKDTTILIYSNHGEVFDHFRYNQPYDSSSVNGLDMIEATSHGTFPYEVLYANMQMWLVPGQDPVVMKGIGRAVDIPATVLDLAGITAPNLDGESLVKHLPSGTFPSRDRYAETPVGSGCLSMVREDGYKLISIGGSGEEDRTYGMRGLANHQLAVFDLTSDPYEYVNLLETTQGQDVLQWAIRRHAELKQPME